MIINDILFIHITKCGGTSIEYALANTSNYPLLNKLILWMYDLGKLYTKWGGLIKSPWWFNKILFYFGGFCNYHMTYKEAINKDLLAFTVIRHPQSRLVSIYTFTKPNISFSDFVNIVTNNAYYQIYPNIDKYILDRIFLSQVDYTEGMDPSFIFKLETINEKWSEVCNKIKIQYILLEKNNKSCDNWEKYYKNKNELVNKIYQDYQQDYEKFSYEKKYFND